MNTAELIISRLPKTPTVTPRDVADAAGMRTAIGIINAIQSGAISAVKMGGRYIIAREAAVTYITNCSKEASK